MVARELDFGFENQALNPAHSGPRSKNSGREKVESIKV
jgi:hypothetical protein